MNRLFRYCPHCWKGIAFDPSYAGVKLACPTCSKQVIMVTEGMRFKAWWKKWGKVITWLPIGIILSIFFLLIPLEVWIVISVIGIAAGGLFLVGFLLNSLTLSSSPVSVPPAIPWTRPVEPEQLQYAWGSNINQSQTHTIIFNITGDVPIVKCAHCGSPRPKSILSCPGCGSTNTK